MERFPESESDGRSGKPVMNFDEPHEWLAVLSSSDHQQNHQANTSQQTPLMTPKKVVRPKTTNSEQDTGKIPSPQRGDEPETAVGDGRLQQCDAFQLNDELVEDDIVASVVVDVNEEGVQLTDDDGNELGGMMVSLSVELEQGVVSMPASDEPNRPESSAVTPSPVKASAGAPKCKTSTVNHQNCSLKHAHSRTHSYRTGMS